MSTPAVVFNNGQIYNPVPLVSISSNPVQNKIAKFHLDKRLENRFII